MMPPRAQLMIRAPLHQRQPPAIDEVHVFRSAGSVHGEKITARQELIEIGDTFDAELGGPVGREEGIEADQLHIQPGGASSHLPANPAQADNAERLAGELDADKPAAFPFAGVQACRGEWDVAGQGHHHGDGMLGRGNGVAAGRVHDDDAAPRGGGDVDIVDAHAGTNDGPQFARLFEQFRGDARAAAHDHALGVLQGLLQGNAR